MCKDYWFVEYEEAQNDVCDDRDIDRFRRRLKSLGFDPHEIDDHIAALELDDAD
jgi:hypothetical protein